MITFILILILAALLFGAAAVRSALLGGLGFVVATALLFWLRSGLAADEQACFDLTRRGPDKGTPQLIKVKRYDQPDGITEIFVTYSTYSFPTRTEQIVWCFVRDGKLLGAGADFDTGLPKPKVP